MIRPRARRPREARRETQARIEYLATHDEMTGLANRTLFNDVLVRATAREGRRPRVSHDASFPADDVCEERKVPMMPVVRVER